MTQAPKFTYREMSKTTNSEVKTVPHIAANNNQTPLNSSVSGKTMATSSTNHQQQQQTTQTSSLPYPHSPDRTLHISLTTLSTSYLLFLTTTITSSASLSSFDQITTRPPLQLDSTSHHLESESESESEPVPFPSAAAVGDTRSLSALGSFVYGLPNVSFSLFHSSFTLLYLPRIVFCGLKADNFKSVSPLSVCVSLPSRFLL